MGNGCSWGCQPLHSHFYWQMVTFHCQHFSEIAYTSKVCGHVLLLMLRICFKNKLLSISVFLCHSSSSLWGFRIVHTHFKCGLNMVAFSFHQWAWMLFIVQRILLKQSATPAMIILEGAFVPSSCFWKDDFQTTENTADFFLLPSIFSLCVSSSLPPALFLSAALSLPLSLKSWHYLRGCFCAKVCAYLFCTLDNLVAREALWSLCQAE